MLQFVFVNSKDSRIHGREERLPEAWDWNCKNRVDGKVRFADKPQCKRI
jgi:hypothetical protein